ncbi:head-tail connector protein [Limosilactobacillus reuteri subsp. suis]|uniref:head-tail connector protein n=1 Tax=Limosilactobacillus reuteri TaxID=1598 RepID=UPI0039958EFE
MADAENSEAISPVSTNTMLNYLNLDDTPENNELLGDLINQATDFINNSFNSSNLSASELKNDQTYVLAVKALVSSLYYDRAMSQGVPAGVKMCIAILQGRYDEWPDKQD